MTILPNASLVPAAPHARADLRRSTAPATERLRRIPTTVEPTPRAPERLVEAEPDYRSPTPRERGRLLLAAYEATSADASQRLLIAELMAHYRAHCVQRGLGDPFAESVPARAVRWDDEGAVSYVVRYGAA